MEEQKLSVVQEQDDMTFADTTEASSKASSIYKDVPAAMKIYNEYVDEPTDMFFIEKVIDWEKRIEGYTNDIKAKYREGIQKFSEL